MQSALATLSLTQVQELAAAARNDVHADAVTLLRRLPASAPAPALVAHTVEMEPSAKDLLAEYVATAPLEFVEPLCMPDRLEVGDTPADRQPIMDMYDKQQASFWTVHEVDLSQDQRDWDSLAAGERFYLCRVLAFFAQADGIVADNCGTNFAEEITWREFRGVFGFQTMMEFIHNITYTELIRAYVHDKDERHRLFDATTHVPTIAAKANWMVKYMDRALPLAARLLAFVVAEGVFFSGSFCAIFWMKKRGLLPGLAFSNELISRDEGMHAETTCLAYSYIVRKLPEAYVHAMFADAAAVEQDFVRESLPVALLGMNADLMCQYIQYVADYWLQRLGYSKVWNACNPFEWMDMISLQGKTNFFEKRVGEYSKHGKFSKQDKDEGGSAAGGALVFDADF